MRHFCSVSVFIVLVFGCVFGVALQVIVGLCVVNVIACPIANAFHLLFVTQSIVSELLGVVP